MVASLCSLLVTWSILAWAQAAPAPQVANEAKSGGLAAFRRRPPARVGSALEVHAAIQQWVKTHKDKDIQLTLAEHDPALGAYVGCPLGVVCDAAYDYRAFVYQGQGVHLRLSFAAALAKEISLPSLRQHFSVASLSYTPDELAFSNWKVWLNGDMVFRAGSPKLSITGFEGGRLQGELKTEINSVIGKQADCGSHDGPLPPDCIVSAATKNTLTIKFDFPLPTGTLDCRAKDRPEFCG